MEDRGPLGSKGRHLYLVEFPRDVDGDLWPIELPAEEMELVEEAVARNS